MDHGLSNRSFNEQDQLPGRIRPLDYYRILLHHWNRRSLGWNKQTLLVRSLVQVGFAEEDMEKE